MLHISQILIFYLHELFKLMWHIACPQINFDYLAQISVYKWNLRIWCFKYMFHVENNAYWIIICLFTQYRIFCNLGIIFYTSCILFVMEHTLLQTIIKTSNILCYYMWSKYPKTIYWKCIYCVQYLVKMMSTSWIT